MATISSPPSSNPSPNIEGVLTLALPAPSPSPSRSNPHPPASSSGRRFPAPCWTPEEIVVLIESYRHKWLSLGRGNLRATHWQEVADTVASRCQHLINSVPPATSLKSSVQCRHKIEKMRKRYRVERQRSLQLDPTSPPQSSWVYFGIMNEMDISGGASAVSARKVPPQPPLGAAARSLSSSSFEDSPSSDGIDEEEDEDRSNHNWMENGRSRGPGSRFRFKIRKPDRVNKETPTPMPTNFTNERRFPEGFVYPEMGEKRRRWVEERDTGGMGEIAAAVRVLGEGFMRMERMKMDLSREFEKVRIEMELKRTEMILDSHQRIVDAFFTGFAGNKKKKKKKKRKMAKI